VGEANEVTRDIAAILAGELAIWFQNLGAEGVLLPRAFSGITQDGKQAIIILAGLSFDHVQRRDFITWLCRHEQFVAYAYATLVCIADDDDFDPAIHAAPRRVTEGLQISASSDHYDAFITFTIKRETNGTIQYCDQRDGILPATADNEYPFLVYSGQLSQKQLAMMSSSVRLGSASSTASFGGNDRL
jgi:hypothetical protein